VAATLPPHPESDSAAAAASGARFMRLGEILIERGKIDAEDLERALELQQERGDKLGKILVDMGLIAQRDMLAALSEQTGVPLVAVDGVPASAPELEGLSHRFLRQCLAFPVALTDSVLTIAMADPLDFETIAAVRASKSRPRWPASRRFSTPSIATTARANRRSSSAKATTNRRAPTWNTCATWPARRRLSGWSTP
jgi:hypothetical protein